MADLEDPKLKAAFAAFFVDSDKDTDGARAFEAASRLYPREKDTGERYRIAFAWPNDPDVILEIQRLRKTSPKAKGIPSKEEVLALMWKLANDNSAPYKDRVAMARLVADMSAYIPKQAEDDLENKRMPSAPVYKIVEK